MSDESNKQEWLSFLRRLAKVNIKSFGDFIKAKDASNKCLSCGCSDLSVPQMELVDKENNETLKHARYDTVGIVTNDSQFNIESYSYWILCENCGHEMRYNASVVLKWVEENAK
ncbi:hypothetical protein L7G72_16785 [Xenorhabdus bovienii]|uniref:hypothetical protein n=1 Tax=Xenorhabdus bovienii TaxID=40576 RepID=UPI001EDDD666|nr:hypothetical protein [Xenorhabdus bovienii]MCG3463460.1 hypothetical protein [Xenorhabdus bovienii]